MLVALAIVGVGIAGCGGPTVRPPDTPTTPTTVTRLTELPVRQPCLLVTSAMLRQLHTAARPVPDTLGPGDVCDISPTLGLLIPTHGGLSGFHPPSADGILHPLTIGGHQALEAVEGTTACQIAIGVSASSRVEVTATTEGRADPCPAALALARLVERRLPSD